jgi:hypothetical protein
MKNRIPKIVLFLLLVAPLLSLCKYSYTVPAKSAQREGDFICLNYWKIHGSDTLLKGFSTPDNCRLSFEREYYEEGNSRGDLILERLDTHAKRNAQYSLTKYKKKGKKGFDYLMTLTASAGSLNMLNDTYLLQIQGDTAISVKRTRGMEVFSLEKLGKK